MCAGECFPEREWLAEVMKGVALFSAASAPIAVEFFCGGVLGVLVRMVQRWVAARPLDELVGTVAMFTRGLVGVLDAFGLAVPQARARSLHPAAQE